MFKRLMLTVLITCLLLSSGCWNRREIDQSAIVIAVGVDTYPGHKLRVTEQIPIPVPKATGKTQRAAQTKQKPKFLTVSAVGDTFSEGARRVSLRVPRSPLWEQTSCYLFGEKFCKEGFFGEIDWLYATRNIRKTGYVFITRKSTPSDVLNAGNQIEQLPANAIVSMIQNQETALGIYTPTKLSDMLQNSINPGVEPTIPGVEIVDDEGTKRLKLAGTGVFKKGRLVGWLNEEESRGFRWLSSGTITGGIKTVKCPVCGKPVTLDTLRSQSSIKPELKSGEIIMNIEVKEEGDFFEQRCTDQLLTPDMITVLNHEADQLIEKQVRASVNKAQKLDSDIFGFGSTLNSSYPQAWEQIKNQWEEVFPEVKIKIKVKSEIRRSYLTVKTLEYKF